MNIINYLHQTVRKGKKFLYFLTKIITGQNYFEISYFLFDLYPSEKTCLRDCLSLEKTGNSLHFLYSKYSTIPYI